MDFVWHNLFMRLLKYKIPRNYFTNVWMCKPIYLSCRASSYVFTSVYNTKYAFLDPSWKYNVTLM